MRERLEIARRDDDGSAARGSSRVDRVVDRRLIGDRGSAGHGAERRDVEERRLRRGERRLPASGSHGNRRDGAESCIGARQRAGPSRTTLCSETFLDSSLLRPAFDGCSTRGADSVLAARSAWCDKAPGARCWVRSLPRGSFRRDLSAMRSCRQRARSPRCRGCRSRRCDRCRRSGKAYLTGALSMLAVAAEVLTGDGRIPVDIAEYPARRVTRLRIPCPSMCGRRNR